MKKVNILILLIGGLLLSACTSWLDVTPEDTVEEEDLFKESTGFHNALNGVYQQMASTSLYGRELTYGLLDAMGQVYQLYGENYHYGAGIKSYHYYYQGTQFAYDANDDIKRAIESIWSKGYNTIANCNNIIRNIDALKTEDFRGGEAERQMIKGEALAARAWIHFDLLRLFAPALVAKPAGIYIPYVTDFPYYGGQSALSVTETLEKIEADLVLAKDMIMAYDTLNDANRRILGDQYRFTINPFVSGTDDGSDLIPLPFYQYRGYRINAMAVTGMLARLYSYWGGEKLADAAKNAQEVIDFEWVKDRKALVYTQNGWSNRLDYDRKCSQDLIFCLSYPLLQEGYNEYTLSTGNACLALAKYDEVWNYDLADGGDFRLKFIKTIDDWYTDHMPLKNIRPNSDNDLVSVIEDMVPMMRLSEMHFILAEYYASIGDFGQAANYLNEVRVGRNCLGDVDLGIVDMETFKARLLGEVRREFFQEGQTFFYYKKYGESLRKGMLPESFVLPKPDSENIN